MEDDHAVTIHSGPLKLNEENELKLIPSNEIQAKLINSFKGKRGDEAVNIVLAALKLGEFEILEEYTELIIDEYFDTEDLSLQKTQASLRCRRKERKMILTIKKLLGKELGQFQRQELSQQISENKYEQLIKTGFQSIIESQLPDLQGKHIAKVLKITNERKNRIIKRGDESYCLSFDSLKFINPKNGRESNEQVEIEIEALTQVATEKLANVRRNLQSILREFTYSIHSKYERGVEYFSLNGPIWHHWLREWNSSLGLTWISIIIGVLGILITIIIYFIS